MLLTITDKLIRATFLHRFPRYEVDHELKKETNICSEHIFSIQDYCAYQIILYQIRQAR